MPDSKNPLDTSYFKCRTPRNYSDEQCFPTNENEDSSDDDNLNGERVIYGDPLSLLRNIWR